VVKLYVRFNDADEIYSFEGILEDFIARWEKHLMGVGYFSSYDLDGKFVTINPANCGVVEMREYI